MPNSLAMPREIISALKRWQAVRKGGWSSKVAAEAHAGLLDAVRAADSSGREPLARALQELTVYLEFLVEADLPAPNAAQSQRLGKLEESALVLIRAERAADAAADPRKRLLSLLPDTSVSRELAQRLGAGRYRVETFDDVDRLLPLLDTVALAAVLIDQNFLMDLGTVAERLEDVRSQEALGATVIYLNRGRDPNNRKLALSSGADSSLEGEDVDYLVARIEELVSVRDRQVDLRVLVVEDDRSQAMYCEAILRKQGIEVRTSSSSRHALDDIQSFAPDLVLMDLHMPDIDGMQLTALIRDVPELALLPIVFLTGEQDEASRFDALRAGGDDYLVKPVRPRHLVTAVVTRARRARNLKQQLANRKDAERSRLLPTGELIGLLRSLGVDRHGGYALLLCAADSRCLRPRAAHQVVEREVEFYLGCQLQSDLRDAEKIAPWQDGGLLMLVDERDPAKLSARAEAMRQRMTALLANLDGGGVSVAVVPLLSDSLPAAETLLDLAERTLAVARHAGGKRVSWALSNAQPDLAADVSLAIQKALALEPSAATTRILFQPIVPLHGAVRPHYHAHLGLRVDLGGERVITRRQWIATARQMGRATLFEQYLVAQVLDRMAASKQRHGLRVIVACTADTLVDAEFRKALFSGLAHRSLSDPGLVLAIDQSDAMLMMRKLERARKELFDARVLLAFGRVNVDVSSDGAIDSLRPEVIAVDASALRDARNAPPILRYARERGAEVVAHFIPDPQTLARLFALGVDYGMGSFISPPVAQMDYEFGEQQVG